MHHPVGDNARDFDDVMGSIIVEFHDVIVLNVAGHRHQDEFRLVSVILEKIRLKGSIQIRVTSPY